MVLNVDRLPFKIRTLVWSFWGEASRVANFWKECWETGWLLLKWMNFAFLLESLISSPHSGWKGYTMVRWKQRADNPFQPDNRHSGLLQRLFGNSISSRPDRNRDGTENRDGFHGNRRSNFYSFRNGNTRFSPTWCFLQRSHFLTWFRIVGRLRFPALGRVFNAIWLPAQNMPHCMQK